MNHFVHSMHALYLKGQAPDSFNCSSRSDVGFGKGAGVFAIVGLQQHALFEYPVDLDQLALTTLSLHCGTINSCQTPRGVVSLRASLGEMRSRQV